MQIESLHNKQTARIVSDQIVINNTDEGADLLADCYYQGFNNIILEEPHLTPSFFDLKTGMAGEVLQKVSNFRMRLLIVGDFDKYTSNSFQDFKRESNKSKQVNFTNSLEEALNLLS